MEMARTELKEITDLDRLKLIMVAKGAKKLFVKRLSPNDNSKNQVYLGPGFEALNIIPNKGVYVDAERNGGKRDRFKADVSLKWVDADGNLYPAASAQLILYPKYPEVRMSGFLKGCEAAPSEMMQSRREGRLLFLGICKDGSIIGHVTKPRNSVDRQLDALSDPERVGVFIRVPLDRITDTRRKLVEALRNIHLLGWTDSVRMAVAGTRVPCFTSNCGGYTLEALLGITPNAYAEPDYLGWEIKQHGVSSFDRPHSGSPVTLMTPEPTGGIYKDMGVEHFVRTFGYPDRAGRGDRLNFGGIYKYGITVTLTGLVLQMPGYDAVHEKITNPDGGLTLVGPRGEEAATWYYADIMKHWNRKHLQAAYIPSLCRTEPRRQYRYGNLVELGIGTDFLKFLSSVARGKVYYDPGIKLEHISSSTPRAKRRSQFRIKPADLKYLYNNMEIVDVVRHAK